MPSELPAFAQQWVQQWKDAAPRLQAIRDEELRRLGGNPGRPRCETMIYDREPQRHGMVVMQQWLLRRHLLEITHVGCDD